ncbi:MAG: hypothetical protein SPI67_01995 [Paludibacteraceae bacterium]|nr:hypothetical protein [Paludibacteraceae bacterium]
MKHLKFLAAVCCVAAVFAACEKNEPYVNEPYVTVVSSNEVMGTVKGEGNYPAGAKINIMATPNTGFYFQQWNDGNTDNPRTITVTGDATYTAIFAANPNGNESGHEWVDLGLSVKWATCNVGATKPEEYGNYYAWGETTTKSSYAGENYKWSNDGCDTFTKYNTDDSYGTIDNKTVLDLADDAARANRGGAWRMPTYEEWQELINNCTWTWTTLNGINGVEVKGSNGNAIFLPAAGFRNYVALYCAGSTGYYWSSSLTSLPYYAYTMKFKSSSTKIDYNYRNLGLPVRPVCE